MIHDNNLLQRCEDAKYTKGRGTQNKSRWAVFANLFIRSVTRSYYSDIKILHDTKYNI